MIYRRVISAAAALTVAGFVVLALAGPASAELAPVSPWQPLDTGISAGQTGWTPDAPQVPSTLSTVSETEVHLEWADGDAASVLGTSAETDLLGVEVEAGTEISVRYTASTPDACAGGAVRVFVSFGDRLMANTGAAAVFQGTADCGADGGTIAFTVPEAGTIRYAGLVFDTSNGGVPGTVVFSDLTIGGELVLFVAPELCEWDDSLTADDPECKAPASPSPTPDTTEPSDEPGSTAAGGDKQLPITGGSAPLYVGAAVMLGGLGAGALALARFRRPTVPTEDAE